MARSVVFGLFLFFSVGTLNAAQWRSHGPAGGAVRTLAAAPSDARVLYFTSGSVLFRSPDQGSTWNALSGPFQAITTFAIDPHDPQTVFVVSQADSLFKTHDGGATWSAIGAGLSPSPAVQMSSIVIDPRDGNVVYLSSHCGLFLQPLFERAGVFKSVDGGLTFARATNGMRGFQPCATGLSLDPGNPDTLYAIPQYTDSGYARSDDGARTWTTAATILPGQSVADPRDLQKRYGSAGGLFVTSTDGGITWLSQQTTALETGTYLPLGNARALTIDHRSGRLFLGGRHGVYRSGDGGRSVLALNGAARESTTGLAFDEATGVLVIGTETGVYRSEAFPWNDWTGPGTGDSFMATLDVAASRIEPATIYAVSLPQVHVTRDHGLTWSILGDSLPRRNLEAPTLASIAVDVAENVYAVGSVTSGNTIYKLAAGTQHWVELKPPVPQFERAVADPGTPGVIYLLRRNTPAMMATRDGGVTWNFHFTPTRDASSLAIDPRDGAVFYAGTHTSLFKSFDGGHTWTTVLSDKIIVDVQISPADPDTVYAIQREVGTPYNHIHVSRDAGATWTSHAAVGEIVSMALDRRDARTIVTSLTDGTVHRSRDEGARWESITENRPLERGRIAFSLDGRVLHATTSSRGIWERSEIVRRRSVEPR